MPLLVRQAHIISVFASADEPQFESGNFVPQSVDRERRQSWPVRPESARAVPDTGWKAHSLLARR